MTCSQDFIARAQTLSERVNTPNTPGNEKAFCDAMLAEMRASKLLAVSVPARLGGPALGAGDIARITSEIARQSGSAGLIYAMHMSQACAITDHSDGPYFDALMTAMLTDQLLIASGTSEKGPGGDILTSICCSEPTGDGGFRVVKESPNISYIDHADLILVTANHAPSEAARKKQILFVAEVDAERFEPGRDTSLLGMRGILNRPWKFTVEFRPEAVFAANFGAVARGTMTPTIHIFWAALWSGIVCAALERTSRFVQEEVDPGSEIAAILQHDLTRLHDRHHMMNAMIQRAIDSYEAGAASNDMGFALSAQINRIKVNCSEIAVSICTDALKLIGLRGYALGGPYSLAECLVDILSGPIMVSNYRLTMNTAKVERLVCEKL